MLEQERCFQGLAGIFHQELHEFKFLDGEADRVFCAQFKILCIEGEIADPEFPAAVAAAAPGHGADARQQFFHGEGLGQVVICACIQAVDAVIHFCLCGQEQDRRVVSFCPH